jgi:uncharacterized protein
VTDRRKLVSVYINEADRWQRRPLHQEILRLLNREGLAGGTVLRAVGGFTGGRGLQTGALLDASGQLPLVVQFVDTEENVTRVIPMIRNIVAKRLITMQDVEIVN